ncbi:YraN family protein [Spongiivirga sp. MCCC 1A20706]|uniref:YraN family protein n=1 Tax=Spongiivirga sp. MCCC 1A20706 TaxID=3160963 RepID=UPI003977E357
MAQHNDLGKKGEDKAIAYLKRKGYQILETNFRFQKAEVDIVALKNEVVIAVEVKTRSTSEFGDPQDTVTKKKISLLVQAMDHYLNENQLDYELRFDIIAIISNKLGTKIEHLKDAFYHF